MLGKDPDIEGGIESEDLVMMLDGLQIEDGDFIAREMELTKKNLREGKQSGPDNIPPEVLKRCDLDDNSLNLQISC